MGEFRASAREVVYEPTLTPRQRRHHLAALAEQSCCALGIAITGHLVQQSGLNFVQRGTRHKPTGHGAETNTHVTNRTVMRVTVHERSPRTDQ